MAANGSVTLCVLVSDGRDRQLKELSRRQEMSVSDLVRAALAAIYGVSDETEVDRG